MKNTILKTRFLKIQEKKKLKDFVKNNYKKDHVIVKSNKIINFFFLDKNEKKINFIGSFLNKILVSIYGVLNNRHWDKNLKKDVQLSLWINKKNKVSNGLDAIKFIFNKIKPYSLFTSGINLKTSGKIFSIFGTIKKYNHFYICNPNIKKKISKNLYCKKIEKKFDNFDVNMFESKSPILLPDYKYFPKKSLKFFLNKYTNNPFYKYIYLNFEIKKKIKFFFVCRERKVKKSRSKVLTIVDFYGSFPKKPSIRKLIISYLIKNKYEYIDFLIYGVNKNILSKIGFNLKMKNQVIPNYFEPFERKNNDVYLAIIINPYGKKLVSVKGDSDQDRPNKI